MPSYFYGCPACGRTLTQAHIERHLVRIHNWTNFQAWAWLDARRVR